MQGTVARFDRATGDGSLLTDDGVPIDFPAASLADHIRHLRVGQRVFVQREPATGEITSLRLWP